MLAGKVRLSTFLTIAAMIGASAVLAYLLVQGPPGQAIEHKQEGPPPSARWQKQYKHDERAYKVEVAAEAEAAGISSDLPEDERAAVLDKLRPVDRFLLKKRGADLGQAKIKDATKGEDYKVNLYQDEGAAALNRAKVDLDRDDKWDEKWTFTDDGVKRQVSPADDGEYPKAFIWNGTEWVSLP